MSTTPANPAPANNNKQIIVPIGIDASGNVEMARIYFDSGITKTAVTTVRTFLESVEVSLS